MGELVLRSYNLADSKASRPEIEALGSKLLRLEATIDYPLGTDRFRIRHDDRDYFAFFKRLGSVRCVTAETSSGDLAGVIVAVRRSTPVGSAWYLGDLKTFEGPSPVHAETPPIRRPTSIGLQLIRELERSCATDNDRAFGISMNPASGPNRVLNLIRRTQPDADVSAQLELFSLNSEAAGDWDERLRAHLGPIGYLSLAGQKDIVLRSTGEPMPLLHLQHGDATARSRCDGGTWHEEPQPSQVHMLSTAVGSRLHAELLAAGLEPSGSATIVSLGFSSRVDWQFVLTSDI